MARLPTPGSDNGTWGDILNSFLSQAHDADGTLKANSVNSVQIQSGAVTNAKIATGTIAESKLDSSVQTKLNSSGGPVLSTDITDSTATGRSVLTAASAAAARTAIGAGTVDTAADIGLGNVDNTSDATKNSAVATLTNKTIDANNNTISNLAHGAEVDNPSSGVHGVTGSVVGTTDTQTLSGKTLSAPEITGTAEIAQSGSLSLYNTADQVTNYERARHYWSSNLYTIASEQGGTGSLRSIFITSGGSLSVFNSNQGPTIGTVRLRVPTSAVADATIGGVNGTQTASSGTQYGLSIAPTINQSGTAAYTSLLVNPTETTTGSGAKLLADFQVGSISMASIDNTGVITASAGTSSGNVVTIDGTQTLTNKTIDGDNNTISNLDIGLEVDWAAASDVSDASAFASGDKLLVFEAGNGLRKIDYDDLPTGSGDMAAATYDPAGVSEQLVGLTATQTLTNKRVTPRTGSVASSATPSIDTDDVDVFQITALATDVTSMTTNLTGTPTVGQQLTMSINDDGTSRSITWGASFSSSGMADLPASTTPGNTHWVGLVWDGSVWTCLASDAVGY